jgi:hypothetical protein
VRIERLGSSDEDVVLRAGALFDRPPRRDWTARFLDGADNAAAIATYRAAGATPPEPVLAPDWTFAEG